MIFDSGARGRVERRADSEDAVLGVDPRQRAGAIGVTAERAAQLADLDADQRAPRIPPRDADERVDGLRRQLVQQHVVSHAGHGLSEVHREVAQLGGGLDAPGVPDGAVDLTQRPHQLLALGQVTDERAGHVDERLAAQRLGQLRNRRQREKAQLSRHLVGRARKPLAIRVGDLGAHLDRPGDHARIDLGHRVELDLERRHDAERPAAAAQGEEEVGIAAGVDPARLAVGRHDLDRPDAVAGEAVLAGEPADAAAEREAGDARVGR